MIVRQITRLVRDRQGSTVIEFGLLAPALIMMLLAVVQFGIAMQEYNALRGIAGDVERYAVVNYQTNNKLTTAQLQNYAQSLALAPPYNIPSNGLLVTVTQPATQRVSGATEYTLTIRAQVNSILGVIGMRDYYINYSNSIFVMS